LPLFELGEWDALIEVAHEVAAWDRTSYQALLGLPYEAHVRLLRGHVADAAALRDEFLPRARRSQDPQVLVPALATAALIEKSRGNPAVAVGFVEELGEATRLGQGCRAMWRAKHLQEVFRVCAATGANALAASLLNGIEVIAPRHRHAVHTAQAVLAEAQGQLEPALALYEEAAERWAEYGFVLEQGQALLGAGRCLLALQHPDRAARSLQKAQEIFESLGARPLVAEAEPLLEQAGAFAS
jgi:tetratricopeptide (TPR) repeat protein